MSSLIEQLEERQRAEEAQNFSEYSGLLSKSRAEPLSKKENDRVHALMGLLNKTVIDVRNDLVVIADFAKEQALAADYDKWSEEDARINGVVKESYQKTHAEIARLNREHQKIVSEQETIGGRRSRSDSAKHRAADLAIRHWRLLGLPDPKLAIGHPIAALAVLPDGTPLLPPPINGSMDSFMGLPSDVMPKTLPVRVEASRPLHLSGGSGNTTSPLKFIPAGNGTPRADGEAISSLARKL